MTANTDFLVKPTWKFTFICKMSVNFLVKKCGSGGQRDREDAENEVLHTDLIMQGGKVAKVKGIVSADLSQLKAQPNQSEVLETFDD